jgi:hypothetical protein
MRVLMFAAAALVVGAMASCGSRDPKLKVTNIEPPKGDAAGGTYVHIYGNSFLTDAQGNDMPTNAKIYFGGQPGKIVRFPNDAEMIVIAPGGKVGDSVDVLITFEGRGEITIPKAFSFYEKKEEQMNIDNLTKQGQPKK